MNAIQPCSNTSAELPYKALKFLRQIQRYKHGTVLSVFVTTLLVGCSSGSSTNTPEQTDTTDPVVATLDTANLKSTAANAFGTSVDTAVIGLQTVTATQNSSDTPQIRTQTRGIVSAALSLNDNSATTREDGIITVDPDENTLCSELRAAGVVSDSEIQACQQLMSDLTVELRATNRTAGVVSYRFQDASVMTTRYAADSESLSVNLNGLKRLSDARDALDPAQFGQIRSPATFDGEVTIAAATTTNQNQGVDMATMSVAITKPVIVSDIQTNLSIGNGELLTLSVNNTTGEGTIAVDIGAVSASAPFRDSDTLSLQLQGITARADIADNGEQLTVSNLGLAKGPLLLNVNSVEALTLTMETFGFTVTETNRDTTDAQASITIDRTMDISLMLNNMMGIDEEASRNLTQLLEVAAPAGTTFEDVGISDEFGTEYSAFKLTLGGPLISRIVRTDETGSVSQSVEINEGTCFDSNSLTGSDSSDSRSPDGETSQVTESDTGFFQC